MHSGPGGGVDSQTIASWMAEQIFRPKAAFLDGMVIRGNYGEEASPISLIAGTTTRPSGRAIWKGPSGRAGRRLPNQTGGESNGDEESELLVAWRRRERGRPIVGR